MGASSSRALARLGLPGQPRSTWLGVAALGLAAVALGTVAWRRARPRRRRRLQQVGTVSKVWIYPIKSCKGVVVTETECTAMGLRCGKVRDRFWMVIKEDGHMITARQEPRLVLVSITLENNYLTLMAPDMDQMILPIKLPSSNKVYDCRLFGLDIKGRDCGDEVAQWFTNYLKTQPYRLVQFDTNMKGRTTKKLYPSEGYLQNYEVSSHLISEAKWSQAWLDTWDELLIGDVEMKKVLSCPRCVLTTVDPDTGIIDRKEPLETLKSYRLCDPSVKNIYQASPLFGMYFSVEKIGRLRVGDPVYRMVD
uniref:Mitochondrial amidoxime reducing component 2 n=1 Tax=Nannospalax galili TaxID=1026970 RepID=A0A8C6RH43_NANGA